jgi:hypothetical protein
VVNLLVVIVGYFISAYFIGAYNFINDYWFGGYFIMIIGGDSISGHWWSFFINGYWWIFY